MAKIRDSAVEPGELYLAESTQEFPQLKDFGDAKNTFTRAFSLHIADFHPPRQPIRGAGKFHSRRLQPR